MLLATICMTTTPVALSVMDKDSSVLGVIQTQKKKSLCQWSGTNTEEEE